MKSAQLAPDLVVMDVNLSGSLDAIDAAHYLHQFFHIPVVFTAGEKDEEKFARMKYSEPYGIIFKPFTPAEALTVVDLALYTHANRAWMLGNLPVGDLKKLMENETEAVVILDKRGRVILLNPYAEWFVDMPVKKAFMRHWCDVMMVVSDATDEEVRDPVTKAIGQMAGTIMKTGISIVTTTSKRRKVGIHIHPVKDNHDRPIAVLMILREHKKTYL